VAEETLMPEPTSPSRCFDHFYESARHNTVLDERTTVMLHLASALALGCYP
jgi:hypothetical protein